MIQRNKTNRDRQLTQQINRPPLRPTHMNRETGQPAIHKRIFIIPQRKMPTPNRALKSIHRQIVPKNTRQQCPKKDMDRYKESEPAIDVIDVKF